MITLTNQVGQPISLTQELGRGGEGSVFALAGRNDAVAKLYHPEQRTPQREVKLAAMVANPPPHAGAIVSTDLARKALPSLAWPSELLYQQGKFVGFVMPRIEHCPNIFEVYNPKLRSMRYPKVDRRFLHHVARNLAVVLAGLHAAGYVMGDVNQKNILVTSQALVILVDTDSFQVADSKGNLYRCGVGVPEYTPPELQGKVLAQVDRRPQHDCFGLGVLLFQLLMDGYHPFTGRPVSNSVREVSQLSVHCIQYGIFPYQTNGDVQPPPGAPNFGWLHPDLQQLFVATFLWGYRNPESRPNALLWSQVLSSAEANLGRCDRNPSHWYSRHLEHCPYCAKPQPFSVPPRPVSNSQPANPGWQPRPQQNQSMPIGCWVDIINALLLPVAAVLGLLLVIWLIKSELYVFILPILVGATKSGVAQKIGPWLVRMTGNTLRGVQHVRQWLRVHMTTEAMIAIGFVLAGFMVFALVFMRAVPKDSPPLPTYIATRVPVTSVPATPMISPLSPLSNVSPLATPTK